MGRLGAASIVLALAAVAALGLSACGGSSADLLPGKTANEINSNLDQVQALVAEGDCAGAEDAVGQVSEEVTALNGVDGKLKEALREGTTRLGVVVSSCQTEANEAAEDKAAEEQTELEEQGAVELEEEELEAEEEQKAKKEKPKKEATEKEAPETEETEPPEGEEGDEKGKGPPAETPGGSEPSSGGVGPGAEAE
jgi:hypothetical protein